MPISIAVTPGALKQLSRHPQAHQQTFRTPLERLPVFVAALLAGSPPITAGAVTIKQIVFTPKHLEGLLSLHNLPLQLDHDVTISATTATDVQSLLLAVLGDWVDFYFRPKPNRFLIYADHDEFTTVFSARQRAVSQIATAMAVAGIAEMPGYSR